MEKIIRVSIFPPKTSITDVIAYNGIVLDSILKSCTVEEECSITGDYTLDATFINDKKLSKKIREDCILKVLVDGEREIFRIKKYDPDLRTITVMAKQYTITEQQQIWLDDVRPTNLTGQSALNYMMNNGTGVKDLNVYSDITTSHTGYYQMMNFYKACFDCDQSFANRWGTNGLETKRRLNNIYFNKQRGLKKQLTIREGKNLTGFTGNANTDSYTTRAIGVGFNGIKGHYIESPKINNYSRVNTQVIKYEDVKVRTSDTTADTDGVIFDTLAEAQEELDRRVRNEFSNNHIDDIKATYNIDFVQLEKTEEYKNYSFLEKADVGDYVKVTIPSMDIDIIVRVMKKKYDIVSQKCSGMTLSNVPIQATSTTSIINGLKAEYEKSGNYNIGAYVAAMLQAGLQDSYVVVRNGEILIMDTKDINTARNVWRWNKGALAHSNDGYYTTNWNVGITQDGKINASMILTGILKTITLESMDGGILIDLGEKGRMSINSSALDINLDDNTMDNVVRVCWNNYSNYVQLEPGQLAIYNGTVSASEKRMALDEDGLHFWRDGYYAGKIGINNIENHKELKGFVFDLETSGAYMAWAVRKDNSATYTMKWSYANKDCGDGYTPGKLHAGCDIDMHNWGIENLGNTKMTGHLDMDGYTIKNAHMENGITGTLNFVQVKQINSDGTVQTWTNNCQMEFKNGILIGGTWGNG